MKKIIVFCVAFLATMSLWASDTYVKNADGVKIWYDFDNESKTASVACKGELGETYYDTYTGEVVIPSTVMYEGEEYNVTTIGWYAFKYCRSLTSVTIPESVTKIGFCAFQYCSSLTSITIPESVTTIGRYAFDDTALYKTESNWDHNVLYIDDCLISATKLSGKYFIKEGTRVIGDDVFSDLGSLTSITIPESVTTIGAFAFCNCSSLTSIYVAPNNENYASIDGVLFSKDKTILIQYPKGKDATSYTIPEGVTEIGECAFYDCTGFTSITCKNTTPPILIDSELDGKNYTFLHVDKSIPLYVPAESVGVYKKTKYWKEFTNIQAIPSSSVANAKAETQDSVRKEYRDGQVLIIKGDKTYTMFGTEY